MEGTLQPQQPQSQTLVAPEPTSAFEKYVIDSFQHSSAFETHVIEQFKQTAESFKKLEQKTDDIIENQQFMMDQIMTHDELDELLDTKLGEFGANLKAEITSDLKFHTTIECGKINDNLTALIKKCDGRTDDVVVTLERKKVIDPCESLDLLQTSPFTS